MSLHQQPMHDGYGAVGGNASTPRYLTMIDLLIGEGCVQTNPNTFINLLCLHCTIEQCIHVLMNTSK